MRSTSKLSPLEGFELTKGLAISVQQLIGAPACIMFSTLTLGYALRYELKC